MKRYLQISRGYMFSSYLVDTADEILDGCIYVANIHQDDSPVYLYITQDGLPILVTDTLSNIISSVLPNIDGLDDLCCKRTFRDDGQGYRIIDLLVRFGVCSYKTGYSLVDSIDHNLREKSFSAIINE